ncbi:CDP-glycerol glycerophosphotransferase family protein [Quadrisphaera sp. DSM 44207]|uniref:CDP-glycerol glycerophosphotransferase family protein n=1 Tax=Quadrisphaera sp. DSM 44207 TaxID=1881057 RepID=UPI00087FFB16|nr:CDP-glycerol glycerophosphotransferase family protein [Quadrisphaera sp. DSM 44207]SDQ67776.1 CDP-glycerol glycerophosphotransferase, TagB/SpsB family [Quadrisphaera sp. DSM 44207]
MTTSGPPGEGVVNRRARTAGRLQPLRTAVRTVLTGLVTALDYAVPKSRTVLALGGDDGAKFGGSSKRLFEDALRTGDWDPYWFTTSRAVLEAVRAEHPGRALMATGPRALLLGVRARAVLVSHSRRDVGLLGYSRLRRFTQLTHGVGPKTMGYAKRDVDLPSLDRETSTYAHVVCASDFEATFWERAYRLPLADIWTTGVPRTDALLEPADPGLVERHPVLAGRTVLYAPTFRDWALLEDYLPVPGTDAAALVALLERHDATLLVRPHYYEADAARATIERVGSPRVQAADDTVFPDANELLKHVDVLVTDYSSIYTDFLLLDRPVVFTPVDLQEYEGARGFFFRYEELTPGTRAVTPEQLLAALDAELSGQDPHRAERARVRSVFHKHPEGGASARVLQHLAAEPVRWPAPPPRDRSQRSAWPAWHDRSYLSPQPAR